MAKQWRELPMSAADSEQAAENCVPYAEMVEDAEKTAKWVIVRGNVCEGFEFYGPYETKQEAWAAADDDSELRDEEWVVAPVYQIGTAP